MFAAVIAAVVVVVLALSILLFNERQNHGFAIVCLHQPVSQH
jgi:hypothetical protein